MGDSNDRPKNGATQTEGLHVVGIGASAGGIRALQTFFSHVPQDTAAAFVVIMHLSPDYESRLAEVLQMVSPLPVAQVTGRTPIEPGHVYVIPPNKALEVSDGALVLRDFARAEHRRAPVDLFFRALADSYGADAACVVLSGTGPNGSTGLKVVKERGGLVVVQDPAEAEYADMPRNSLETGLVDYVLPAADMPARITAYFDQQRARPGAVASPADDAAGLREVLATLRTRTGHDFSNYKAATLQRRVERRLGMRNVADLSSYARLMRQDAEEAVALMKELLISVTTFYRDADAWKALEERVIPRMFQRRGSHDQVRVWVAGCATGEEAYAMAILLAEAAGRFQEPPSIQVFATDLDEQAIAVAREGFYTEAEVVDVSEARLQRFFHCESGGYRVKRELREHLLFAHHDLIKDPPFSHLDLVSCRNMLIYLNRAAQDRVIETFHFALRPGGYLFLGLSESAEGTGDLFLRYDAAAHVYESRATGRVALPVADRSNASPRPQERPGEMRPAERLAPAHLHQRLLERYAPPSLIATEDAVVVHMSERVGRFLQVPAGEPSRDLLSLVRPELRPDLRAALHQALAERRPVDVRAILVSFEDGDRHVDVSVRPVLKEGDPPGGYVLVLFDEIPPPVTGAHATVTLRSPAEPRTLQLEDDLARVKAQLRATIIQYETQAQEGKASNEELQAMNEELRSAAEELETSKEELQSVNEELTTVNQELKIKIEELSLTNNDFRNFISATDIGSIFLDRHLRVKFSTPRARSVFNLLDTDIGRPLTDITSRLKYDRIHEDVRTVLDRLTSVEQEVEALDGRWHLMRLLPYRTLDDRIDGVVLTFQDVTTRRLAEQQVRQSEERLRLLIESATDYAIFTVGEDGRIESWTQGAERLFGFRSDEVIGRQMEVLYTDEDRAAGVPAREIEGARLAGRFGDERMHVRKDGTRFHASGVMAPLGHGGLGFVKIARDLTRQRAAADAIQQAHAELEARVHLRTGELETALRDQETARGQATELLHRLVNAQETERTRVARDLHDSLGQQLTALRLVLEREGDGAGAATVQRALDIVREIGAEVDSLAWELRPRVLDELGLAAALPRFVEEWAARVGVVGEVRVERYEAGMLPHDTEVAFYRIVQEALNNVAKHAHASRADVVLSATETDVLLVVEDDGIGFSVDAVRKDSGGTGLLGMQERATLAGARLQVESSPGQGTAVYLRHARQRPS